MGEDLRERGRGESDEGSECEHPECFCRLEASVLVEMELESLQICLPSPWGFICPPSH